MIANIIGVWRGLTMSLSNMATASIFITNILACSCESVIKKAMKKAVNKSRIQKIQSNLSGRVL